jgi:rfaE bifunctional protein kinase chain/domain
MLKPVLVLGDVMLDKYIEGHVSRVSPEAPVPVVSVEKESYRIGGSGNVAHNIIKQEVPVLLAGCIGGDVYGTVLTKMLHEAGIQTRLPESQPVTTTKIRIIGNHQQIVRIDYEKPGSTAADASLLSKQLLTGGGYAVCVVSDYNKGFCTPAVCRDIIESAAMAGIPVIVDPKHNDWSVYEGAYLVTPNFKEFCQALNRSIPNENDAIEAAAKELKEKFNIANLLVTRSDKGMSLLAQDGVLHLPAYEVDVYDVSGAGDTVVAVIAASLAAGSTLAEAVTRANIAGAIVVSKFGTYAVSRQELDDKIKSLKK